MRLWSLHPRHLDAKGLVALWREGLLARAVLAGNTRGYRHHPQLERFRQLRDPLAGIDRYLAAVLEEATARGYSFDRTKIVRRRARVLIDVTAGQIEHERRHLRKKLKARDPARLRAMKGVDVHPVFRVVDGAIEPWERVDAGHR